MSQGQGGHPAFQPRSAYSSKLPDRTAGATHPTLPQQFVQSQPQSSNFARRPPEQQPYGYSYAPQGPSQQQRAPVGGRPNLEKESNAPNDLSEEQRDEINEAFSLFDLDRDRHMDFHELRVAFRALGFQLPKAELIQILAANGIPRPSAQRPAPAPGRPPPSYHPSQMLITQHAFARVAAQKMLDRDPREEVDRAFFLFDLERKDSITLDDLRRISRELGETGLDEEELRVMIEEFDYEGLGGVSREAFYGICLQ